MSDIPQLLAAIGKRAVILAQRRLVSRDTNESGWREFSITDAARDIYVGPMAEPGTAKPEVTDEGDDHDV